MILLVLSSSVSILLVYVLGSCNISEKKGWKNLPSPTELWFLPQSSSLLCVWGNFTWT